MRPLRCVNHTLAAVGTCIAFSSLAGAQTGTDASVNSEELQEVVVTAEKVPQDAQKTARAVTVINSDELRRTGDTTLDTVLTQVPGVTLQGMFGRQIYIRGIGSDNDPTNADPPVVINVDGVSQMGHATALGMPTTGATSALLDVDNIQVVSGPEGVTQGRNALAGSVNINSHAPDLGKVDGYATVKYGNYNSHTYDAAVNLPIGDTLAIRVAGLQESHEGYIHSNYTLTPTPPPGGVALPVYAQVPVSDDEDIKLGRVRLLWKPIDDLSVLLTYNYSADKSNIGSAVPAYTTHLYDPWLSTATANYVGPTYTKTYQGEVDWNMHWAQLTVIPALQEVSVFCNTAITPICTPSQKQTTVEARIASPANASIQWLAGIYYLRQNPYNPARSGLGTFNTAPGSGDFTCNNQPCTWNYLTDVDLNVGEQAVPTTSKSVFGNFTFPFTEQFRARVGARYTDDKEAESYQLYAVGARDATGAVVPPAFTAAGNCANCVLLAAANPFTYNAENHIFSYNFSLEYDVAPKSMVYFGAHNGFSAGGVDPTVVPPTAFAPQKLTAFTLGSKNRFLDDRLQVNVEAYYNLFSNFQLTLSCQCGTNGTIDGVYYTDPGKFSSITYNAGTSTQKGIEFQNQALITRDDRVNLNLTVSQGKYGELDKPLGGAPFLPANYSLTGQSMALNPSVTGNFSYTHIFHVLGGTLMPRADVRYSGAYWVTAERYLINFPGTTYGDIHQTAFWKYDAYLNYESGDGHWNINFYEKNIENSSQVTFIFPGGTSISDPRTFGVGVGAHF